MGQPSTDAPPFGLLNIHKPPGPTSHDIVDMVRRGVHIRRVGHAGTLDPLAEGVLVLALGKATRLLEYLAVSTKHYRAVVKLGVVTDTYDRQGNIVDEHPLPDNITFDVVRDTLQERFVGTIQQVPPIYSAVKVGGKTAHSLARAGQSVTLAARSVEIHTIDILEASWPYLELDIHCGPGTYIRSLAHDLGQTLGCGAILTELIRQASGDFQLENAVTLNVLQNTFDDGSWHLHMLPADLALRDTPQIRLDEDGYRRLGNGLPLAAEHAIGLARAYSPDGRFVAVLIADAQGRAWRPKKVFV